MAVNCCGGFAEVTDGERVEIKRSGQLYKYPFDTQKGDYKFWDATVSQAMPSKFVKVTEIDGLTVYEFQTDVPQTTVGTREVPASLVGEPGTAVVEVEARYQSKTTHWVEPVTGAIIDRRSEISNTLAYEGEDRVTTTGGVIEFTDAQVEANVEDFEASSSLLKLLRNVVPLVGVIGGLLLIVVGVLLGRRGRRESFEGKPVERSIAV